MKIVAALGLFMVFGLNTPLYAESFKGFECTEDVNCVGHASGYLWADSNEIRDDNECQGVSQSFIEGCLAYLEEIENNAEYYSFDFDDNFRN
jgi:hypothetical protein